MKPIHYNAPKGKNPHRVLQTADTVYCQGKRFKRMAVPGKDILREIKLVDGKEVTGDVFELKSMSNMTKPWKDEWMQHVWRLNNPDDLEPINMFKVSSYIENCSASQSR